MTLCKGIDQLATTNLFPISLNFWKFEPIEYQRATGGYQASKQATKREEEYS